MKSSVTDKHYNSEYNLERVFVYGTLKRGFGNGERLLSNARFIGEDSLSGFVMVSLGAFPAIVPTGDKRDVVHGEVFEVNEMEFLSLDRLEGYPSFYDRMRTVTNNLRENVWVYYHHPESRFVRIGDTQDNIVQNGVW